MRRPSRCQAREISLTVDVNRHIVPDRTIVGLIEGSDPQLKNEVVIVSAHHDHQGADGDQIFNGADDNVSGTAAVIDIAEAYVLAAQAGVRPKRSILFAVFGSEERGPLLGSWAYTERPLRPLDKTVAVLNMDMIGRNMEVPIGGGARFAGLTVQSAESNANSVNIIGHSRHPALKSGGGAGESGVRADAEDGPRQQRVEPAAPQRSVAVPAARRARGVVPHRACTRTITP